MKVSELIELLKKEDQDRLVVLAKDSEGNSYSPVSSCWAGAYRAELPWCGEVGLEYLNEELKNLGYSEEDVFTYGEKALVITPMN